MNATAQPTHRLCLVTGSRSEFGLLEPLCAQIASTPGLELKIIATAMHLSQAFGETYQEIEQAGYAIDERVPMLLDTQGGLATALAVGLGTLGLAPALERQAPDLVICMGDRFELLALAAACTTLAIPLAHISGGEVTEGAMDDGIRHAMTKLSHLHLVANQDFARRVRQLGEEPWRICVAGEPGLDYIKNARLLPRAALEEFLGLDLGRPTALVTFHPVTHELGRLEWQVGQLAQALELALEQHGLQYVVTFPNADPGHQAIIGPWQALQARHPGQVKLHRSLGRLRYTSLLGQVAMMIGNSSSGLVEGPSFNLPVVNIGTRQQGRPQAANVIQTGHHSQEILAGIQAALAYDLPAVDNPFGDGRACPRIRDFLLATLRAKTREQILRKKFADLQP